MRVEILASGIVIGTADLADLDPPMGVATGRFAPGDAYDRQTHAYLADGEITHGECEGLSVFSSEFGEVECAEVAIDDMTDSLGEIRISILGIPYPQYGTYFAMNPEFRKYWHDQP